MRWVRLAVLMSVLSKTAAVGLWLWMGPELSPAIVPTLVAEAEASGHGGEKAKPEAKKEEAKAESKKEEPKAEAKKEEAKKEEPKKEEKAEAEKPREPEPISPEILARSRAFREMLSSVDERNTDIRRRERELAEREATLKLLQQTVANQVARLKALTKEAGGRAPAEDGGETKASAPKGPAAPATPPPAAAAPAPAAETAGTPPLPETPTAVAKIYESMKAEDAAPILDRMDDVSVREILLHMKERQIGAILAVMNKDKAVAVTKALASAGKPVMPAAAPAAAAPAAPAAPPARQ